MRTKLSKFALAATLGLAITFTLSCSSGEDDPDGGENGNGGGGGGGTANIEDYRTVPIGTRVWMAQNLNYNAKGSKCYNNDPINCAKYGRLYNWTTAMALPDDCYRMTCSSQINAKHRGICPSGWHIPNDSDWDALIVTIGGLSAAGTKLKATSGWNDWGNGKSGNGTDEFGFSALPTRPEQSYTEYGCWWGASEADSRSGLLLAMINDSESAYFVEGWNFKEDLYSVRCVMD